MKKTTICIIGGGSQSHIFADFLGSKNNVVINILTRRPNEWSKDFTTIDLSGKEYKTKLHLISDEPKDVIPNTDILLFCLPGYAVKEQIYRIRPFLKENHII